MAKAKPKRAAKGKSQTLADLAPSPRNPNRMDEADRARLAKALAAFGDLSGIVYNRRTQTLVGGHQRASVMADGVAFVEHRYDKPEPDGTVERGVICYKAKRYSYRVVDWPEKKANAAMVAANRYGRVGYDDEDALQSLLEELNAAGYDMDLTGFDEEAIEAILGEEAGEAEAEVHRLVFVVSESQLVEIEGALQGARAATGEDDNTEALVTICRNWTEG